MRKLLFALVFLAEPAFSQSIEVGGGGYVNEENSIDVSTIRAWGGLNDIELPLPGKTATGVMAEGGYSDGGVIWGVWSVNRTEIKRVIAGVDMKIAGGGPVDGSAFQFDTRVVAGYRFTEHLAFYSYFLEDQTPVGFALGWKF